MRNVLMSFLLLMLLSGAYVLSRNSTEEVLVTADPSPSTSTTTPAIEEPAPPTPPESIVKKEKPPPPAKPETKVLSSSSAPSTPTTTVPEPRETPSGVDYATQIAAKVLEDTNVERKRNGLPALKLDSELALVARAHSADMLAKNYFDHTNKSGCNSACRAKNAEYTYTALGENIFMTSGINLSSADTGLLIVQGWMGSPGHRANILQKTFTRTGIGVALEGGKIYTTALYSKPR